MLTPPDAVSATGEYHVIVINGVSMDGRITQAKINIAVLFVCLFVNVVGR